VFAVVKVDLGMSDVCNAMRNFRIEGGTLLAFLMHFVNNHERQDGIDSTEAKTKNFQCITDCGFGWFRPRKRLL
jgi:hypothetical protein